MEHIFITVLNMTFTASFVIAAIILARLFLKKMPTIISYVLWIAAGLRLLLPFSIESTLSLIPFNTRPIPHDIATSGEPVIETGIPVIDSTISSILPVASQNAETNYLQIFITAGAFIWITGACIMFIYGITSAVMLGRKLEGAVQIGDNIYAADIKSPFVMGFLKPAIYVPVNLSESEREHVILHESVHIKRFDNIIKVLAYLILSLHWFNLFVWAAFIMMSIDMEMSCTERVSKEISGMRKEVSSISGLSLVAHQINLYPLVFGEGDTKKRFKNLFNVKKKSEAKILVSIIMVVMLTVGFTFNNISAEYLSESSDFRHAADFLTKLHFISEDGLGTAQVSRAEMAFFTVGLYTAQPHMFFESELAEHESGSTFLKVDYSSRDYYKAIERCIKDYIMPADWFAEPQAAVTFHEAVKMLVTALGYETDDYIAKARTREVRLLGEYAVFPFEGVPVDKILTKNEAVMLVYNCMMSEHSAYVEGVGNIVWDESTMRFESEIRDYKSVINTFGIYVATPISSKIKADGEEISLNAYNINGSNYFRIRDIAYILNGTSKQFEVGDEFTILNINDLLYEFHGIEARNREALYTNELSAVIVAHRPYTVVGGELPEKKTDSITAFNVPFPIHIYHAGREPSIRFEVYEISGSKYVKLRDIAEALDFSVKLDELENIILIDTGSQN